MDEGPLRITSISSRQILNTYWNNWYNLLKCSKIKNMSGGSTNSVNLKNESLLDNDIVILCKYLDLWKSSLKGNTSFEKATIHCKNIDFTKQDEGKNISIGSVNLVNTNEKISLNNDIEILSNYWGLWRAFVKANSSSKTFSINCKRINLAKLDKVANIPTYSIKSVTFKKKILHEKDYEMLHNYWNLWSFHHKKIKGRIKLDEEREKSLDLIAFVEPKMASLQKNDLYLLNHYWNLWRESIKANILLETSSIPLNKIDRFITVIQAEKKKTAKKYRSNYSLATADKENNKRRRDSYSVNSKRNNSGKGDMSNDPAGPNEFSKNSLHNQGNCNQTIRSLIDKNISISSLKNEVKTSLKKAHSLLENTIVHSLRGNCGRRKNFKHHRKGSPVSLEMPDSDILERMKIREIERAKRWQLTKERRQKLENEKIMKILQEEKEKLREKQLSKKIKHQELKEKRQREIEHEKHLEQMKQKYLELNLRALNHYNGKLLRKGICGFINALQLKAMIEAQASKHHEKILLLRKFNELKNITHINKDKRLSLAMNFHHKMILKTYFQNWLKLQKEFIFNQQAAIDFYEMRIQDNFFLAWNQYTCDIMIEENFKLELAEMLYRRNLLKKSFHCWKRLPAILQSERAKEKIKNIFRQKVLEVIPDFCPEIEYDL